VNEGPLSAESSLRIERLAAASPLYAHELRGGGGGGARGGGGGGGGPRARCDRREYAGRDYGPEPEQTDGAEHLEEPDQHG